MYGLFEQKGYEEHYAADRFRSALLYLRTKDQQRGGGSDVCLASGIPLYPGRSHSFYPECAYACPGKQTFRKAEREGKGKEDRKTCQSGAFYPVCDRRYLDRAGGPDPGNRKYLCQSEQADRGCHTQNGAVAYDLIEEQINTVFNSLEFNWNRIIETGIDFLKNGAGNVLGTTFSVAMTLINSVMNFVIAFVFACYVLLQKEKLSVQIKKVLYAFFPGKVVRQVLKVASLSYKTFSNFVTGQCLEAVILGTMFFVVMTILKFPYALLVGVVIACTALIPIFGAFIGCVVGTFLILVVNPMRAVAFVILFLVLQQIEGNLIYPHVVGNSVGLPSIWVLMAVTVGGNLMGVVGMLVFIPLTSILYALFRQIVHKRLKERKIHDI